MIHYPDIKLVKKSVPCLSPQNVAYTCFTFYIPCTTMIYERWRRTIKRTPTLFRFSSQSLSWMMLFCERLEKDNCWCSAHSRSQSRTDSRRPFFHYFTVISVNANKEIWPEGCLEEVGNTKTLRGGKNHDYSNCELT